MFDEKALRNRIINWNIDFPIDRWWREKHKVPFMSTVHREVSFLDQLFEYKEEKLIDQFINDPYNPNIGDWISKVEQNIENQSDFIRRMRKETDEMLKDKDFGKED